MSIKSNLGIIIYSNDPETVWNAFRLANFALTQKETVNVFLLGKGVEIQNLNSVKFDVQTQIEILIKAGGQLLACGTCLKLRNEENSSFCPISTMAELFSIIKEADKIITF
jgi:sulfur relay (sulfurtransferase) complex TusBCD TusD component (DsrE family)